MLQLLLQRLRLQAGGLERPPQPLCTEDPLGRGELTGVEQRLHGLPRPLRPDDPAY